MAAPLLQRAVIEAVKGEFSLDDLKAMSAIGRVLIGVAERDGVPIMAAAVELARYPRMTALNVMALGGSGLAEVSERFFDELKAFARSCGASRIEASGSKPMVRLLRKLLDFQPIYEKVGYAL